MLHKLFTIIYRMLRKVSGVWHSLKLKLKVDYLNTLFHKSFAIHSSLKAGKGFSVETDLTATTIAIKERVRVRNYFNITMGHSGDLRIDADCFFNNHCSINCLGKISIGSNCQFGENVRLYDHNHRYAGESTLISEQGYSIGLIQIGSNCWIGSNVVILKDVVIGDNVVIGAGCVIYKSIETGSIVINKQSLQIKPREN